MYTGARLPARIPRVDTRPDRSDLMPTKRASRGLGDGMLEGDTARLRRHQEHYHASVAFVDEQIGRILAELDRLGLADNTLVLATSDHGEMLGDLDCFQKSCAYESATHIPLIMRWPGQVNPGAVDRDRFVDLNDILPTFLDAAGVKYPGPLELPGGSLLDPDQGRDRAVQYMENGHGPKRWCALRDERYKFVYAYFGGWEALFDLQNDPGEQRNILADGIPAEHRAVRDRLFKQLVEYEERWGLENMVVWKDFMKFAPYDLPARDMNAQYPPPWITNLTPAERAGLGDPLDEVIAAVKEEPTVKLSQLDIDRWAATCAIPAAFIDRIRKTGL